MVNTDERCLIHKFNGHFPRCNSTDIVATIPREVRIVEEGKRKKVIENLPICSDHWKVLGREKSGWEWDETGRPKKKSTKRSC